MSPRSLLPVLLLAAAACSVPHSPPQGYYRTGQGSWGDRMVVDVIAMPVVWVKPDAEDRLVPGAEADTSSGPGFGVRGAIGNRDQSIGILVHGASLEGDNPNADLDAYAVYFDFDASVPLVDEAAGFFAHAAAGFGVAQLDFDDDRFDDATTGAVNLRFDLEFAPSRNFALLAGIGGFLWGYPGDSEAFGSFLEIGGRFSF